MLPNRDITALQDMLAYAQEAVEGIRGRQREDLDTDRFFELGLQRLMEIVGEAAARVSVATRDRLPQIEWGKAIGMRNRLIHGYDVVEADVLWTTVLVDLPELIRQLTAILGEQPVEPDKPGHI